VVLPKDEVAERHAPPPKGVMAVFGEVHDKIKVKTRI